MTVGVCFGGYCPLHRGHLDIIMRAKKEHDKCLVVVCGYDNEPRTEEIGLTLDLKYNLIKRVFEKDEQIKVVKISDSELGLDQSMSPENWKIWSDKVMTFLSPSDIPVFYVAEEFYKHSLSNLGYSVVLMPRILGLSGTEIRKNPVKNWNYIEKHFRDTLTTNILITGTASEGKSTLARDISVYYSFPLVEEYGRLYMENFRLTDEDLDCETFKRFLDVQRENKRLCQGEASVVIHDTDNLVTMMYAEAYFQDPAIKNFNHRDFRDLCKYHNETGIDRNWNKIYLLPPKNNFVDDGTRYMKQATLEERNKNYDILCRLLKKNGLWDKVEILRGNYYENFDTIKRYINSLI